MHSPPGARADTSRPEDLRAWLTTCVAGYLDNRPEDLDASVPLAEYGLDSVYALAVCGDVEDHLGLVVEPTLVWDYPTIDAIADYLHAELGRA